MKYITFILSLFMADYCYSQCDDRYVEKIFRQVDITYNIDYGRNMNSRGISEPLKFDIYQPQGDTASLRAVLVMMHGGAYWVGKKNHAECTLIGQDLGRMGYVVISPDYRRENTPLALLSEELMIKAVGRGTQDAKAMVRFLYKSAKEGNPYRIDTNKIFLGGASAGAFNALHACYLEDSDSIQAQWRQWLQDIGGLEGTTGNEGYSTRVAGIISISGALGDIRWMYNNTTPLTIIHNTRDPQIPYYYGQPYGIVLLPFLYGGGYIHPVADSLGIYNTFYSIPTEDHTAYEENGQRKQPYYDSTVYYMTHFMQHIMGCDAISTPIRQNVVAFNIFKNNTIYNNSLYLSDNIVPTSLLLYDMAGHLVFQTNMPTTTLQLPALPVGSYLAYAKINDIWYTQRVVEDL